MNSGGKRVIVITLPSVHIEVPAGYRIKVRTLSDGSQEITLEPI